MKTLTIVCGLLALISLASYHTLAAPVYIIEEFEDPDSPSGTSVFIIEVDEEYLDDFLADEYYYLNEYDWDDDYDWDDYEWDDGYWDDDCYYDYYWDDDSSYWPDDGYWDYEDGTEWWQQPYFGVYYIDDDGNYYVDDTYFDDGDGQWVYIEDYEEYQAERGLLDYDKDLVDEDQPCNEDGVHEEFDIEIEKWDDIDESPFDDENTDILVVDTKDLVECAEEFDEFDGTDSEGKIQAFGDETVDEQPSEEDGSIEDDGQSEEEAGDTTDASDDVPRDESNDGNEQVESVKEDGDNCSSDQEEVTQ